MSGGSRTKTDEPWEAQIDPLKKGFARAETLLDETPASYYSGPTTAGWDPAQQAAQAGILGYTQGPRPQAMQKAAENQLLGVFDVAKQTPAYALAQGREAEKLGADALAAVRPTATSLMSGAVDLGSTSPYSKMMDAFGRQATNQLTSNILPGIRQGITSTQAGGGTRGDIVQANAIATANQQMLDKAAEMYGGAYQQAQAQRLPATAALMGAYGQAADAVTGAGQLGLAGYGQAGDLSSRAFSAYPSLMGAPLSMYGAMQDVGDRRQALSQQAIRDDIERYIYESTAPMSQLQNYMSVISGDYGGSQTVPGPSGLQTLGQMASIAAPFMMGSDIRIKENIVPEGARWKGLQIYTYNYRGDPTPRRGVMAQEVEKVRPDAVTTIGGIKHVNYGIL